MNKQAKSNGGRGIEWTDYTWNVIGGCHHGCRWTMPDGTTAICYAEEVATKVAQTAYPHGFEHHYFHADRLQEPLKLKTPAKIFPDSMADMFGSWVPENEVLQVLDVMKQAHWHTFQSLTKAAGVMLKYKDHLPTNLWAGASVPPTVFKGKTLSEHQQAAMLHTTLKILAQLPVPVRWLSIEPLSFDVSPIIAKFPGAIQWAVIGAASNGAKKYQPKREWVERLLEVLDKQGVKVFFKGNLEWSPWREEFPAVKAAEIVEDKPVIVEPVKPAGMTPARIAEIRARVEACENAVPMTMDSKYSFAHLHRCSLADMRYLLDEVERLQQQLHLCNVDNALLEAEANTPDPAPIGPALATALKCAQPNQYGDYILIAKWKGTADKPNAVPLRTLKKWSEQAPALLRADTMNSDVYRLTLAGIAARKALLEGK